MRCFELDGGGVVGVGVVVWSWVVGVGFLGDVWVVKVGKGKIIR